MITIPASSLAGGQIIQAGSSANSTGGQGTVTVAVPVTGNVVNAGGMVMVSHSLKAQGLLRVIVKCNVLSHIIRHSVKSVCLSDGPKWQLCSGHATDPAPWSRDAGGGAALRKR